MVGMMLMTFLLFFAFVVNTGMLVNAKINLQNAADLAAYSGAATQARLLNNISYLNYEMRREYKKFLFRYYVLGNMAQSSFPHGPQDGPMPWKPSSTSGSYGVPIVCMIFNQGDNFCHLFDGVPSIATPASTPLDSINQALQGAMATFEQIKNQNCEKIGKTNYLVLLFWLYNVDPTYEKLAASLASEHANILSVVRGLAHGLGFLPRELILRLRIRTLQSYVNAAPVNALDKGKADALSSGADPMKHERTINAFLSAYNTLGNHTFASDSIYMDELLPEGEFGANLLKLKDNKVSFDAFSMDLSTGAGTGCKPKPTPITLPRSGVSIGVYKDPTVLTYYAIRLKAKAKVLFSPFGEMELKAYSAAQPFGSRIGPMLDPNQLMRDAYPTLAIDPTVHVTLAGKIPNLPVFESDNASTGKGWDSMKVGGAMFQALGSTGVVNQSNFQRAYQVAMAPNPWELRHYNILVDTPAHNMVRNYDIQGKASIWAPVFPPGVGTNVSDEMRQALDELYPNAPAGSAITTGSASGTALLQLRNGIRDGMTEYISNLMKGKGEGGEGYKIVHIRDPLTFQGPALAAGGAPAKIPASGGMVETNARNIMTSWDANQASDDMRQGRVGYSVKFVSFETLTTKNTTTNGLETWTNEVNAGGEGEQDLPLLNH
ncbi:MAG: hypothetical protein A2X94_17145 [Bdellovibrionales bacterium GWB1_55_8]|nr:MAG: hypothetical protein A2X94_17145 [Bdellovibrionales bacterium GWB1_55_8]